MSAPDRIWVCAHPETGALIASHTPFSAALASKEYVLAAQVAEAREAGIREALAMLPEFSSDPGIQEGFDICERALRALLNEAPL